MEYALTVGLTLLFVWGILFIAGKRSESAGLGQIVYSQSAIHAIIKPYISKDMFEKPKKETQSTKHIEKNTLSVLILDNEAYWVYNNVFYVAEAVDGLVNPETTRPVDINSMTKKEIDKMLFILDSLNKGNSNDSSSAGDG